MMNIANMRPLVDTQQFILVYPLGLPIDQGETIWDSESPTA